MKAAEARAIRKSLKCIRDCKATGSRTHHPQCPAFGKWGEAPSSSARSRGASVPVAALEELVTTWRDEFPFTTIAGQERKRCADALQAVIDRVTP